MSSTAQSIDADPEQKEQPAQICTDQTDEPHVQEQEPQAQEPSAQNIEAQVFNPSQGLQRQVLTIQWLETRKIKSMKDRKAHNEYVALVPLSKRQDYWPIFLESQADRRESWEAIANRFEGEPYDITFSNDGLDVLIDYFFNEAVRLGIVCNSRLLTELRVADIDGLDGVGEFINLYAKYGGKVCEELRRLWNE